MTAAQKTPPLDAAGQARVEGSLPLLNVCRRRWPGLAARLGHEEAESVGRLALCVAAACFEEGRGSAWSTWAVLYVRGYWRHAADRASRTGGVTGLPEGAAVHSYHEPGLGKE